ncbi:MAG: hypothetical protein HC814_02080 [Rhodobacteraceae bacterium]|nr:hypothetical protein [Paracoccaceae bacterium]
MKRALAVTALSLAAGLGSGCSGINASHSVSPATFLLPGLLQVPGPASSVDDTVSVPAPMPQIARLD